MIMVPGHGIWKFTGLGDASSDWFLESFQLEGHDHLAFKHHITTAFTELEKDPESLIVFSGGQTKEAAGPLSEAQSYWFLARAMGLIDAKNVGRVHTEEYARDSFENVLFSLARFKEITGAYPKRITIPGFEFKRHRFLKLHFPALKYPVEKVNYIGNAPTPDYQDRSVELKKYFDDLASAEYKHAVVAFEKDPLGNGSVLGEKKAKRNPFKRQHPYAYTNPQLAAFFTDITNFESVQVPW